MGGREEGEKGEDVEADKIGADTTDAGARARAKVRTRVREGERAKSYYVERCYRNGKET